ncbi:MAG: hypothetical protein ACPGWR_18435 [Ardenticatenaceae bacterium]
MTVTIQLLTRFRREATTYASPHGQSLEELLLSLQNRRSKPLRARFATSALKGMARILDIGGTLRYEPTHDLEALEARIAEELKLIEDSQASQSEKLEALYSKILGNNQDLFSSDWEALGSDWEAIGDDLKQVLLHGLEGAQHGK